MHFAQLPGDSVVLVGGGGAGGGGALEFQPSGDLDEAAEHPFAVMRRQVSFNLDRLFVDRGAEHCIARPVTLGHGANFNSVSPASRISER